MLLFWITPWLRASIKRPKSNEPIGHPWRVPLLRSNDFESGLLILILDFGALYNTWITVINDWWNPNCFKNLHKNSQLTRSKASSKESSDFYFWPCDQLCVAFYEYYPCICLCLIKPVWTRLVIWVRIPSIYQNICKHLIILIKHTNRAVISTIKPIFSIFSY